MPPKKLEELFATLAGLPNDGAHKTRLKRTIGSKSAQVALDKAGRLCIPDEMAKAAGITDEAVLVGMLDQFEIWNPGLHEKINAADEALSQEAFKLLE
jgi:MraZ protein